MDAAILTLIGQLGTAGIFVFACYRIYTDSAKERESFRAERMTWVKILERLDRTNNALIMAIENQNTIARRTYPGALSKKREPYLFGPEPDIDPDDTTQIKKDLG